MPQETAAARVRLNDDVWRYTAAILGDAKALCALEEVSRELLTVVRKHDAAWRVALDAGVSPVLAAALVKAAPGARNLCRGWLQRWRAERWEPESEWDPTLCVQWGGRLLGALHRVRAARGLRGQSNGGRSLCRGYGVGWHPSDW